MSNEIVPFRIAATDAQLDDLKRRLRDTRWPERECVDDWTQGLPLAYAQEVCATGWRSTTGALAKRASIASRNSKPPSMASESTSYMCAPRMPTRSRW